MTGSTVLQYRIIEKIGEGGMGVVYKAHDTRLERSVALKFLPLKAMTEEARTRFIGEAQAAARVQHPNICPVYEIGEYNGQLFFAMAYLEGNTVSHLIRETPLPVSIALDIAIQVAHGLEAAHKQGVIHRDIKASNVAVDSQGHASILDFGIALRMDSERLTATGGTVGTPAYMSPEQAQALEVDQTTDIWSLAVVLHEMLTGQLPFQRKSQFGMLQAIVKEDPPTASTARPEVPSRLDDFLRRAFEKEPGKRWQSAVEAAAELRRIRDGLAEGTATVTRIVPVFKRRNKSRVLVLGAVALAAVAGYWAWHSRERLPDEKRIAVLPLEVVGNDAAVRTLADGLVETLTSKLSQIEEFQGKLMVVPASEVRNRKITSAEAARRIYDANLAITGSAQRWGDRIQFTLNLVDTATVRQLASRTFEFDAAKPIALRDEAVNGTVRLLALKLTAAETGTLASGETQMPGAYAEYLKGVGYLARYDLSGNVDRAIESLTHATRLDAKYALAFAALGQAHWVKAQKTETDKQEVELALGSIREAIRLDPRLAEAHVRLGEIYANTGQPQEGIQEARSALKISPGSAEAYTVLGQALAKANQFADAENAYREAVKRKPLDWHGHLLLGLFYYNRGRNDEARAAWEEARKLTPDNEVIYRDLAALDVREGKFQQASEQLAKAVKFEPNARTYSTLGVALYYQRRYAEAAAALNSGVALDMGIYTLWGNLGTVYRHLPGSEQKARNAFEKAIGLAVKQLATMKADDNTHANLGEYWAKLGNKDKALGEIAQIPEAARGAFAERIALAYELTGDHQRALETVKAIPAGDSLLTYVRNDPDLEKLR
jgi:tetratricopeptide (TPR) repeat protein